MWQRTGVEFGWRSKPALRAGRGLLLVTLLVGGATAVACGASERDFGPSGGGAGGSGAGATGSDSGGDNGGGAGGEGAVSSMIKCTTTVDCPDSESCCDGSCFNTSSEPAHCGGCGEVCAIDNAESSCNASQCGVGTCVEGFVDCNGTASDGCEEEDQGLPSVPTPSAPMVGAYTGSPHADASLTPTFEWTAPSTLGTCGAVTYQLQLTRECVLGELQDCAFAEPDIDEEALSDTMWTPSQPLDVSSAAPVGAVYFWRVRACEAETRCSDWSPVRYVNVGRLQNDVNGDGYADLLMLGASSDKSIQGMFFAGGSSPPLSESDTLGDSIGKVNTGRFVGDVNGDGFGEVLAWSSENTLPTSVVPVLLFGGANLGDLDFVSMPNPVAVQHRGASAGDFDGDGFVDVVLSEFETQTPAGTVTAIVRLYPGARDFAFGAPLVMSPPSSSTKLRFGEGLEGGIDFNGDGYPDLFIGDVDDEQIHIAFGGGNDFAISMTLDMQVKCKNLGLYGFMAVGDVNGDDFDDLTLVCTHGYIDSADNATVAVFLGGEEPATTAAWDTTVNASFPNGAVVNHDLGSDGRADLVVNHFFSTDFYVRLLPGAADLSTAAFVQLGNIVDGPSTSTPTSVVQGDYDGDGRYDLAFQQGGVRLLLGGETMASDSCLQPASSFDEAGNWCTAKDATYKPEAPYADYGGTFVQ